MNNNISWPGSADSLDEWANSGPGSFLSLVNKSAPSRDSSCATLRAGTNGTTDDTIKVRNALDLPEAKQPRWLAKGRLPKGAVTLLVGDEGIGKSLFWVKLVTHITTGAPFEEFGIPERDPGYVVLVITEDNWDIAVLPRLKAAGADLRMVKTVCSSDGTGLPTFPDNIELLENIDPLPELIVIDTWLDIAPQGKRLDNPQQARQVLHPFKQLAERAESAVLLVGHTNRAKTNNLRDKYGTSYALRQKVRMALVAQRDDHGQLLIGPEKSNGAVIQNATIFQIVTVQHWPATDEDDGLVPVLAYVGQSDKTASEHFADSYTSSTGPNPERGCGATSWLKGYLQDNGRTPSSQVKEAAESAGHHWRTVQRAAKDMEVRVTPEGFPRVTYWSLSYASDARNVSQESDTTGGPNE